MKLEQLCLTLDIPKEHLQNFSGELTPETSLSQVFGSCARGPRGARGELAALVREGAARASAEPVSSRGRELGAPPSAALPAPHAVG